MLLYIHKEVRYQVSKKKKQKKRELYKIIAELLIALGTFFAGLASFIQALK